MAKKQPGKQKDITEITEISEIEELRTNEMHCKATNQLAQALGELSELDDIYRTIHTHIKNAVRSDAFIVSLYDSNRKMITAEYVIGEGAEVDPSRFPEIALASKGHGTQSQCIRTGLPQYFPDYQKAMEKAETQYSYTGSGTITKGRSSNSTDKGITNSAMYVPMKTGGKVIGVIQVQSHRKNEYSSQDIELLSGLANIAAIAIRNATANKLVMEEKNKAIEAVAKEKKITAQLTFLAKVSHRSNLMISENEICGYVCQKLKEIVGNGYVVVSLTNKETQAISIRAMEGMDDDKLINKALRLLGTDPRGMQFSLADMVESELKAFRSGKLELISGGIYTLLTQRIPKAICKMAERLLHIHFSYVIGFNHHGRDLGGVVILSEDKDRIEDNRNIIETMVNQTAVLISRIRTDSILKTSEECYRSIFEDLPISLQEQDLSEVKAHLDKLGERGVKDFKEYFKTHHDKVKLYVNMIKVLRANEATLELYKALSFNAFKDNLPKTYIEESYDVFIDELAAIAENKTSFESEVVYQDLSSNTLYALLKWHVSPGYEKQYNRVIVSVINITQLRQAEIQQRSSDEEKKKLEIQLGQAQKMEAIGKLAGGVAHDFNNLITVIMGYSELLLGEFDNDDPKSKEIKEIMKAGERAAGLTRQLLAFSRRQQVLPKILNLNELITNLSKMLQRIIGEDIEYTLELDGNLSNVKADPGQVEQIILNLAVNARDAMSVGGRLKVITRDIQIDEDYARLNVEADLGKYVCLMIEDTGSGIETEVLERIFEPFFTTKKEGEGTGLGLSVVYGIVKQNGGWVDVYSEVGKGTIFKVYFPAVGNDERQDNNINEPDSMTLTKGARILLVEDEEGIRKFAVRALRSKGYQVYHAEDASKALRTFSERAGDIDVVLTDVVLPGRSGIDLAKILLAKKPDIPIIFCSGYTDQRAQLLEMQDKGYLFLQKPYSIIALVNSIEEAISRK